MRMGWAVVVLGVAAAGPVMAHGRMAVPLNRSAATDANNVDMTGGLCGTASCAMPCGGVAKPANATFAYQVGSMLNTTIETTIAHTGGTTGKEEFDFYWSPAGDTGLFTGAAGLTPIATAMPTKPTTLPSMSNFSLTLPSTAATNGTLQMVMVNKDSATTVYYVSCVDIELTTGVPDAGVLADLAVVDAATASSDLSGSVAPTSTDMATRPNAGKASLPGCSIAAGGRTSAMPLASLLLLAYVSLRSRRALFSARRT